MAKRKRKRSSKKRRHSKGHIPLAILKRRHARLGKIISGRSK